MSLINLVDREGAAGRLNRESEDLPERGVRGLRTKPGAMIPLGKEGNPWVVQFAVRGFFFGLAGKALVVFLDHGLIWRGMKTVFSFHGRYQGEIGSPGPAFPAKVGYHSSLKEGRENRLACPRAARKPFRLPGAANMSGRTPTREGIGRVGIDP